MHSNDDPRFTAGLIYDVIEVLEKHGYQRPHEQTREFQRATGATMGALLELVETFEGKETADRQSSFK